MAALNPVNEANDLTSMNKVFEYCALEVPTMTYRLTETIRLLGDVGVDAPTDDPEGLADACLRLMQDDDWRREECAERARRLSAEKFIWENEAAKYVAAFESLIAQPRGARERVGELGAAKGSTASNR